MDDTGPGPTDEFDPADPSPTDPDNGERTPPSLGGDDLANDQDGLANDRDGLATSDADSARTSDAPPSRDRGPDGQSPLPERTFGDPSIPSVDVSPSPDLEDGLPDEEPPSEEEEALAELTSRWDRDETDESRGQTRDAGLVTPSLEDGVASAVAPASVERSEEDGRSGATDDAAVTGAGPDATGHEPRTPAAQDPIEAPRDASATAAAPTRDDDQDASTGSSPPDDPVPNVEVDDPGREVARTSPSSGPEGTFDHSARVEASAGDDGEPSEYASGVPDVDHEPEEATGPGQPPTVEGDVFERRTSDAIGDDVDDDLPGGDVDPAAGLTPDAPPASNADDASEPQREGFAHAARPLDGDRQAADSSFSESEAEDDESVMGSDSFRPVPTSLGSLTSSPSEPSVLSDGAELDDSVRNDDAQDVVDDQGSSAAPDAGWSGEAPPAPSIEGDGEDVSVSAVPDGRDEAVRHEVDDVDLAAPDDLSRNEPPGGSTAPRASEGSELPDPIDEAEADDQADDRHAAAGHGGDSLAEKRPSDVPDDEHTFGFGADREAEPDTGPQDRLPDDADPPRDADGEGLTATRSVAEEADAEAPAAIDSLPRDAADEARPPATDPSIVPGQRGSDELTSRADALLGAEPVGDMAPTGTPTSMPAAQTSPDEEPAGDGAVVDAAEDPLPDPVEDAPVEPEPAPDEIGPGDDPDPVALAEAVSEVTAPEVTTLAATAPSAAAETSAATSAPGQVPSIPRVALPDPSTLEPSPEPAPTTSATVLCVANQKGGVGKTTTAVSLAAALAQLGVRVLMVDLDPQGNATTGLGLRADEGELSSYHVLVDQRPIADVVRTSAIDHLDVVPSSLDLAGAEVELVPAFSREVRLRRALDAVRGDYDVVFVDCPPSLGMLTVNALAAADEVLVPIQCEYYALEGLGQLLRTVKLVSDDLNRSLQLGGVVLTMYDGRTKLSQQVVDEVRAYFGEKAYGTVIPRTVRLSEAPSFGQPITVFDPTSRGSRAYQRLASEVAERHELPTTTRADDRSPLDRLLGAAPDKAGDDPADDRSPLDRLLGPSPSTSGEGATEDPAPDPTTTEDADATDAADVTEDAGVTATGPDPGPSQPPDDRFAPDGAADVRDDEQGRS